MSEEPGVELLDSGEEHWVGDDQDGCYYQAEFTSAGWFVRVWVDCETGHFCEDLTTDGPFASQIAAEAAGHSAAVEWCLNNQVAYKDPTEVEMAAFQLIKNHISKSLDGINGWSCLAALARLITENLAAQEEAAKDDEWTLRTWRELMDSSFSDLDAIRWMERMTDAGRKFELQSLCNGSHDGTGRAEDSRDESTE